MTNLSGGKKIKSTNKLSAFPTFTSKCELMRGFYFQLLHPLIMYLAQVNIKWTYTSGFNNRPRSYNKI
jgi:hypothetical protein